MAVSPLWVLCAWLFLDGATFSVATTPLLLLYAPGFPPWQVAVAGGLSSAAGNVVQLVVLRWMLANERPWMGRLLPARATVEAALAQYPSAKFLAILIARATPLPDAPIKLVAAMLRYPLPLYFLAVLLGALPYYWALAWVGHTFKLPVWLIAGVAALFVIGLAIDQLRRGRSRGAA